MLTLQENPPALSPWASGPDDLEGQWWVGHTKSRFEKAFAWDLHSADIGYFFPMTRGWSYSGRKKRAVMKPLFPSYVFFNGDSEARYIALTTGRLCQAIEVLDQPRLAKELGMVHRAVEAGAVTDLHPWIAAGRYCRIRQGPLAGVEGKVLDNARPAKIVLEIGILGQGAVVEIEADLLEPVE